MFFTPIKVVFCHPCGGRDPKKRKAVTSAFAKVYSGDISINRIVVKDKGGFPPTRE